MSRRAVVLLLLLLALGVVYLWVERPGGLGRRGPGSVSSRSRAGGPASEDGVLPLAVAELDRESAEFSLGRNPFSYGSARRAAPAPPPVTRPRPEPRPQQQSEAAEPPAPKPPPIDVVYLGNFGRPGHRIAVFSDTEGVYNAQVGDVLKQKFRLVHIGYESVDLAFVGFPDTPPTRLAAGRQ